MTMLIAIILAACSPAGSPDEPAVDTIENQLVGTNWELITIDGVEAQDGMTLSFSADTVSGSDGCNTFAGEYTIENGPIEIGENLALTAMACPDKNVAMSRKYMDAFLSISSFTFDNDSLTMQTESGELVFAKATAGSDTTESEIDTMVNPLVTTNWELVSMAGAEVDGGMTLSFGADTISGSDGCNIFSSDYTVGNGSITVSDNIASTMIACPEMDAEMSQQYLNALVSANAFTHDNNSLTIETENGELVFTPVKNAELDGTRWQLTSLADSDGNITRMAIDSDIFIMFVGDQVNANGGCNSFSGEMTIENPQMSFGNIAATLMACADEEVEQRETEFFAALNNVSTYEIVGQTLTLYDADGATMATFDATAVE